MLTTGNRRSGLNKAVVFFIEISEITLCFYTGFFLWYLEPIYLFKVMSEAKAQAKALREGFLKTIGEQYKRT